MKKYLVTVAAVLAMAGAASAADTNVIYLTGATAYRAATHKSITNLLSGCTYAHNHASDMTKAGRARFIGTYDGQTVEINCSWSGSLDGIQRLVYRGSNAFDRTDWPTGGNPVAAPGTANATFGSFTGPADGAMSDSYQNSTLYQTPTLVDTIVGVIPFKWVRNNGAPSSIANMTPLIAQQMLSAGEVPLSFFSGSSADTTPVKTAGRNADSGTRVCTFSEAGFGATTPPVQQEIWANGTVVTNVKPYRAESVLGTSYPAGQSGYSSGGTLATRMTYTGSSGAIPGSCHLVAALGLSDAGTAIAGGGAELTWNGVGYSADNVRNGKYTFWSHEHMFYRDDIDSTKQAVLDALAAAMQELDPGSDAIKLDTMTVTRPQEGAPVAAQ